MLSEADIKKYIQIQSKGTPIPRIDQLVSVTDAVELVGKTKAMIRRVCCENPARVVKGDITWFVIGSIIMLDRASLIQLALSRGWIEEV